VRKKATRLPSNSDEHSDKFINPKLSFFTPSFSCASHRANQAISTNSRINNNSFSTLFLEDDDDLTVQVSNRASDSFLAADSACTLHLVDSTVPLLEEETTPIGVSIMTASSTRIHGTSKGLLPIKNLPPAARVAHRVKGLHKPLLSMGQFADNGCVIIFDKNKVSVLKSADVEIEEKAEPLLIGPRTADGLWTLRIKNNNTTAKNNNTETNNNTEQNNNNATTTTMVRYDPTQTETMVRYDLHSHIAHSAYHQANQPALATFLHSTAGSPPLKTFCNAIDNGFFATWPGLTSKFIRKYLEKSVATVMGRQKRMRQGIRSTKEKLPVVPPIDDWPLPPPRSHIDRTHEVGAAVFDMEDLKGLISTDLPGRFPFTSSRGMNYIFILYDFDSNAILAEPIKSRSPQHLIEGYEACYNLLEKAGIKPIIQRLDNEASKELIKAIEKKKLQYQLATPYDHRNNFAERAIQTFKSHFISILNGTDSDFPSHLWCRLIYQAVITLNMLRRSRINPKLSAYNQIFGNFDFNATPLAPCGMKAIIYEKKAQRISTWSDHGQHGWYVGPKPNHYRNYNVYVTSTRECRGSDTVDFFPSKFKMPKTSSADRAATAIEDLTDALNNPHPACPFVQHGTKINDAIRQLEAIFNTNKKPDDTTGNASPRVPSSPPQQPPRVADDSPRVPPRHLRPEYTPNHPSTRSQQKQSHPTEPDSCRQAQHFGSTAGFGRALSAIIRQEEDATTIRNTALRQSLAHLAEMNHQCHAVTHPITGKQMEYRHLIQDPEFRDDWLLSCANELGRLAQGVGGRIKGTNTIFFINKNCVPKGRTVTYARTVCSVRPEKEEKNRTRITAGGNLITDYPGNVSTETAGLETIKIHWNSVLSTPGAKWMGMDISNMYLNTPLDRFEYMRIRLRDIPQEIIDEYNLNDIVADDGYVYIEIQRAMYGLAQSGALSHKQLETVIGKEGYYPSRFTPGLYLHKTRPISFTLVVDDFGVKYINKDDALHLEKTLQDAYPMKSDWKGERYIGIDLDWDYEKRTLKTSMKGYVQKALIQFQHESPKQHHYAPSKYIPPNYGSKQQMTKIDTSDPISKDQKLFTQQVTGKFLYYARSIDDTMLHMLNELATLVNTGTQETMKAVTHFLNYCASNPDAEKLYRASDMILTIDGDAAYLVAAMARSRAGGFHYLGNKDGTLFNGSIYVLAKIIKNVMGSAAEAECGGLYMNAKQAIPERMTLIELGHPQPATPLKTDNSTADGIMNSTVKQQRSKAIDMRFYWLRDRVEQGQFRIYWAPGSENFADYFTKHHPPSLHKRVRSIYLHTPDSPTDLQGCLELLKSPTHSTKRNHKSATTRQRLTNSWNQISVPPTTILKPVTSLVTRPLASFLSQ